MNGKNEDEKESNVATEELVAKEDSEVSVSTKAKIATEAGEAPLEIVEEEAVGAQVRVRMNEWSSTHCLFFCLVPHYTPPPRYPSNPTPPSDPHFFSEGERKN